MRHENAGILLKTLAYPLVIVSDIHVQRMDDPQGQMLMDLLDRLDVSTVKHLVLVGDIFDFFLGRGEYFVKKFAPLGAKLAELLSRGVNVQFIEGNHEFAMTGPKRGTWEPVPSRAGDDLRLEAPDGKRLGFIHGDVFGATWDYRIFRKVIKARFTAACAAAVPGSWLDAYALAHARVSRNQGHYRTLNHDQVLAAAARWADTNRVDAVVFGHFHTPYADRAMLPNGQSAMLYCLPCWDSPNALVWDEKGPGRIFWNKIGEDFQWEPCKPFLG